jgi:hypothetical protein
LLAFYSMNIFIKIIEKLTVNSNLKNKYGFIRWEGYREGDFLLLTWHFN